MKARYLIVGLLFFGPIACTYHDVTLSKNEKLLNVDCAHSTGAPVGVVCNGSICQSDTCSNYFGIWKGLFLKENQMTEAYYNNHISICKVATYRYPDHGIQFEITYKLSIDWFETSFEEGFMIWLDPAYLEDNPTVNLPSDTLLSNDQISANMDNPFFGYAIHTISSIEHLKYASRQEALDALALAAGVKDLCVSTLSIQYQHNSNPPLGHPILNANSVLNWNENKCVSGVMDLSSDYLQTNQQACIVD